MFRILSGFLILVFFSSLATLVLLSKKPICIDSSIVDKIDILNEYGTQNVYSCSAFRKTSYDESLETSVRRISKILGNIELYLNSVSRFKKLVHINWLTSSTNIFRVQGHEIYISDDLIFKKGILERAILKAWLRERYSLLPMDRTLVEESVVDLIQYSLGSFDLRQQNVNWPTVLKGEIGMCNSAWLPVEFHTSCSTESQDTDHDIVHSSLRPLLSTALIESFETLGLHERMNLLSSLPEVFSQVAGTEASQVLTVDAKISTLDEAKDVFAKDILIIKKFGEFDPAWKKLTSKLESQLMFHGYKLEKDSLRFDLVISASEDVQWGPQFIPKIFTESEKFGLTAIFDQDQVWLSGLNVSLPRKFLGTIHSHQMIYFSCEIPNLDRIRQFSGITEKLLFIRICEGVENLKFEKFFQEGAEGFAKENSKVAFMQLHLPSLRQAWFDRVDTPLPMLASRQWSGDFFQRLGWREPIWDSRINAYRTRSNIEAISIFRMDN